VIPVPFEYARAASVDDALARLAAAEGAGKLIAGGHSLVPMMKLRLTEPSLLIDIARIPGLAGIRESNDAIEIGAATTHHDVATSAVLRQRCPVLPEAAAEIGDPQVRNRGTIGGSLAHADPSADYPAVMLAVDADIHIRGPRGERRVKASAFFQNLFTVDLGSNEMIVALSFSPTRSAAYAKLHQKASHYAIVGVAAALDVAGGSIRSARIGVTGAGSHAVRLPAVEAALEGTPATPEAVGAAARAAGEELGVINGDVHASAEYRRAMIPVLTRRALLAAQARA
jgi:carbon-monoxide dehydrogenase medium subunit